jgi:hypothetical protein
MQKRQTLQHQLPFKYDDETHQPHTIADNEAPAVGKHIPYPNYGRSPVLHSPAHKESAYAIFWSSCSSLDTSYETAIPFQASSHGHSNSDDIALDLSFCCACKNKKQHNLLLLHHQLHHHQCHQCSHNFMIASSFPLSLFNIVRKLSYSVWLRQCKLLPKSYIWALNFSLSLFFKDKTWLTKLIWKRG